MPFTASSPIEPPGKRIGLTTKLSVVSASPSTTPASPSSCQRLAAEGGQEEPGDERLRRLAARTVRHRDPVVPEARRLRAHALDQSQRLVLTRADVAHTTSRSRAKRP